MINHHLLGNAYGNQRLAPRRGALRKATAKKALRVYPIARFWQYSAHRYQRPIRYRTGSWQIEKFGSLAQLLSAPSEAVMACHGIGMAKYAQILASLEWANATLPAKQTSPHP